ncbi:uncharacterized protein MYCFIDRAFT_179619 [Pseudocercospora fijiensis CIRAD86]|uniref:Uncharacterized protein n=1 Tax=Pseudocercospora fijiensis (strain CIRAD86) TaxID=383855 RepID=M3AM23_PSEFD|nr:uncharacterized protein MYCFIDRAFT_179619 [Pseudocercospora fijiensis CIRAD86]EME78183.1 hypothetical protein MYCFIDRAFT_179619 [Pseudocercospora fijiensis CIRAD86]
MGLPNARQGSFLPSPHHAGDMVAHRSRAKPWVVHITYSQIGPDVPTRAAGQLLHSGSVFMGGSASRNALALLAIQSTWGAWSWRLSFPGPRKESYEARILFNGSLCNTISAAGAASPHRHNSRRFGVVVHSPDVLDKYELADDRRVSASRVLVDSAWSVSRVKHDQSLRGPRLSNLSFPGTSCAHSITQPANGLACFTQDCDHLREQNRRRLLTTNPSHSENINVCDRAATSAAACIDGRLSEFPPESLFLVVADRSLHDEELANQ